MRFIKRARGEDRDGESEGNKTEQPTKLNTTRMKIKKNLLTLYALMA